MIKNTLSNLFKILLIISLIGLFQFYSLYPAFFHKLKTTFKKSTEFSTIKYINVDGKKVKTIFVKGKDDAPLIIYFHGNYELIDNDVQLFEYFSKKHGFNTILIEYNGYGDSEGIPSLSNTNKAVIEWLKNHSPYGDLTKERKNEIIVWGKSIGSGHAFDFIANNKDLADKIIIHAGFLSPVHAISSGGFSSFLKHLMIFNYDAEDKIKTIADNNKKTYSALIVHGTKDEMFDFKYTYEMKDIFTKNNIPSEISAFHGEHNSMNFDLIEISNFIKK
jgi:predicted esterase